MNTTSGAESGHTNCLSAESSPYLLQHAHNPVDWYPWNSEALEAARRNNKPILLSIGYSSCHWCHVMERESFENDEIARLMNEHFINIKVDREERPDLDAIYMNYVQMTSGHGGWPLTVFLTPDLLPFYGGTYFPPEDHYGRPGFGRVLISVARFFREETDKIDQSRSEITRRLQAAGKPDGSGSTRLDESLLEQAFFGFLQQFDNQYGGFGKAPKFPTAMGLAFLLRYYRRRQVASALQATTLTLDRMARGGIYDQLGGGFHRYSVDDQWLVPHFEKMLYDNALLARVYLEAYQVTGDNFYRNVVEESLEYVERDLSHPEGGFFSAEDADSEGIEGKFYVWSPDQTEAVLGSERAALFNRFFDVTPAGNWEGSSILRQPHSLEEEAQQAGLSPQELRDLLKNAAADLLRVRDKRTRPGLDHKVLASWNGLMLSAFAEAAMVLQSESFKGRALRNARFLVNRMVVDGRLRRCWTDGDCQLTGYLDDFAHVIEGLLLTYQLCGDSFWLEQSQELMEQQIDLFYDRDQGNFYFTATDQEKLLVRPQEFLDNATPSGNSTTALNLLRLARLTGDSNYSAQAEKLLAGTADSIARYPLAFGNWLSALDYFMGPVAEIAIVGAPVDPLLGEVNSRFLPNKVVAFSNTAETAGEKVPLLNGKKSLEGKPTAYLCQDFACQQPVTDPEEFGAQLDALTQPGGSSL